MAKPGPKKGEGEPEIPIRCAYSKLVAIGKLKPHPKNRNKHPKEQIERLAEIIKYQGIRHPIKVSRQSGFITAGHGRMEAFRHLKIKNIPVDFQSYESDEQEYADIQSDNAIALWAELDLSGINSDVGDLGPDFNIDMLGIKDFVIEPADKIGMCDEDAVAENVDTRAKLGDRWLLGEHVLVCGDCTDTHAIDLLMMGEKADMVFTDPPYGLDGKNYFNDYHYDYDYDDAKAFDLTKLAFNTDFVIWGANYYDYLPIARAKIGWIVWDKRPTRETWDQETRESADRRFGQHFEIAVTNVKGIRGKMLRHTWGGFYGTAGKPEDTIVHKTQKPVDLLSHFIADSHKIILDYFAGSGSTLIACEKLKRRCFAMEIMPEYCDVILARWEKYTGQKAELARG